MFISLSLYFSVSVSLSLTLSLTFTTYFHFLLLSVSPAASLSIFFSLFLILIHFPFLSIHSLCLPYLLRAPKCCQEKSGWARSLRSKRGCECKTNRQADSFQTHLIPPVAERPPDFEGCDVHPEEGRQEGQMCHRGDDATSSGSLVNHATNQKQRVGQ